MKHNAHYPTKFDGFQIPTSVVLVDLRNDEVIKEYSSGSDFGEFLSDVFNHLNLTTVALDVRGSRMTIFAVTRFDRIRLCTAIRDFIRKAA